MKTMLHPAVFAMAMRMLPGVAELHAIDKPSLSADDEGGLYFYWHQDESSPLFGRGISIDPPKKPDEEFEEYNPWKVGQAPVHPPGVWGGMP
jgi:hypothetical protein